MKKLITLLSIVVLALSLNAQVGNYSVGDLVDDFTVTDVEGVTHTLSQYTTAGKHVYIDFFYTTCGPCQAAAPTFNEFYDKYGCNSGDVICIVINSGQDNDDAVIAFEETYGGNFNHAVVISGDGGSSAVASDFGISYYPTFCMVGPDGLLKESDIWPIDNVGTFEATFPDGFDPSPMACTTFAETNDNDEIVSNIYPNPASDFCYINYNFDSNKNYSFFVVNVLGQEVFANNAEIQGTNAKLNTESYDKGIYIVRILEEGTPVADIKLQIIK